MSIETGTNAIAAAATPVGRHRPRRSSPEVRRRTLRSDANQISTPIATYQAIAIGTVSQSVGSRMSGIARASSINHDRLPQASNPGPGGHRG